MLTLTFIGAGDLPGDGPAVGPGAWPWRLTSGHVSTLVWPAIWAEVRRALGEGDWRPSLASLDVIRLLGPAPPPA